MSRKIKPSDLQPIQDRLNGYKETMNNRLAVASIPNYHTEKKSNGFKM